jgi:hypothetical protein
MTSVPYSRSYRSSTVWYGSFPRFLNGNEPGAQVTGEQAAQDESARLDADHLRDALVHVRLRQGPEPPSSADRRRTGSA